MSKRRIGLVVVCVLLAGMIILFSLGPLSYYWQGTITVISVYLVNLFFDNFVLKFFKDTLPGLFTNQHRSGKVSISENKISNVKDTLEGKVEQLCETNIKAIKQDIQFIEVLNWEFHPQQGEPVALLGNLMTILKASEKRKLQSFVVIGEAGVGKTSAIFQYILDLIKENKAEDTQVNRSPVPVYFSLTSLDNQVTINDWLVSELKNVYGVHKKIAQYLLDEQLLMPYLDGVDQVKNSIRKLVIEWSIDYSEKSGAVVMTCRPEAYEELLTQSDKSGIDLKKLFFTYKLMPLTRHQVNKVVESLDNAKDVKGLIDRSAKLRSFIRYPMALFLLYKTASSLNQTDEVGDLEAGNYLEIFDKLWQKYNELIFEEKSLKDKKITYDQSQFRSWLGKISATDADNFFIEELQPGFLTSRKDKALYFILSRVFCCLALAIAVGFYLAGPLEYLGIGVLSGLVVAGIRLLIIKTGTKAWIAGFPFRLKYVVNNFVFGIPVSIGLILFFGFTTPRMPKDMLFNGLFAITEANAGVFIGIFMGLVFGQRDIWQSKTLDIKPVERVAPDWKQFFKYGALGGTLVGLFLMAMAELIIQFFGYSTFSDWIKSNYYSMDVSLLAFLAGLVCGFPLVGMLGWFKQTDTVETAEGRQRYEMKPNHGVNRSVGNAIRAGALSATFMVIAFSMFFWLFTGEFTSVIKGVKAGFGGGLLGALWFGGLDVIQHYTLRLVIYTRKYGPWNYPKFLKEASDLRFVRMIGSSYVFMHPTLQSYFLKHRIDRSQVSGVNKIRKTFIPLAFVIVIIPVLISFYNRFVNDYFWKNPYGFEFRDLPAFAKPLGPDKIVITGLENDSDTIEISSSGIAQAGAFTGYTTPSGTEAGFIGFTIGNVYDYDTATTAPYSHAALLIKKTTDSTWMHFPKDHLLSMFTSNRKLRVAVKNKDTLQFLVNDSEYHNNTKGYDIMIKKPEKPRTLIVSHRGAAGLGPENTLASIRAGLNYNPDIIEIDVRQTSDGKLVLMHDQRVNRTTEGRGKVGNLTFSQIREHVVRHEGNEEIRVPELADVLDLIKTTSVNLLVELKQPSRYPGLSNELTRLIEERDMVNQIMIYSFDKDFIREFKKNHQEYEVGIFAVAGLDAKEVEGMSGIGFNHFSTIIDRGLVSRWSRKGYKVFVWSVNTPHVMQAMIEKQVHGIITDYPDRLHKVISY